MGLNQSQFLCSQAYLVLSGHRSRRINRTRNMSDSLEYNCIIDCTPELRRSAEPNLLSLCAELLAARLINEDKEKSLRNRSVDEADRAAELISQVTNKVKENSANYHVFVAILEKDEPRYNSVLTRMKERYKSRERVNSINASAPKQAHIQSSDDHDNGVYTLCHSNLLIITVIILLLYICHSILPNYVHTITPFFSLYAGFNQKCKHVVSKPMVDNCCQTLHNPSKFNIRFYSHQNKMPLLAINTVLF